MRSVVADYLNVIQVEGRNHNEESYVRQYHCDELPVWHARLFLLLSNSVNNE